MPPLGSTESRGASALIDRPAGYLSADAVFVGESPGHVLAGEKSARVRRKLFVNRRTNFNSCLGSEDAS